MNVCLRARQQACPHKKHLWGRTRNVFYEMPVVLFLLPPRARVVVVISSVRRWRLWRNRLNGTCGDFFALPFVQSRCGWYDGLFAV